MKILITVFLAAAIVVLAVRVYRLRRRSSVAPKTTTNDEGKRRLQERLVKSPLEIEEVSDPVDIDLSESGTISIADQIDRCIAAGLWDEALKWSHHAIDSRPDSIKFKMKLAEVHCGAGSKEEFRVLFDELHEQVLKDSELRDKLHAMAAEIIPDHPLVS